MAESKKSLTRSDIHRLLGKLDAELARRGHRAVIFVVGGANIAMAVDGSRTTTDIDGVVKQGFNVVFTAARAVARAELGLGDDWSSAAFTDGKPDGGISWQWVDNKEDDTPDDLRPQGHPNRRFGGGKMRGWLAALRNAAVGRNRIRQAQAANRRLADKAGPFCGAVKTTSRGDVEISRSKPCSRNAGHKGKHRFDGRG